MNQVALFLTICMLSSFMFFLTGCHRLIYSFFLSTVAVIDIITCKCRCPEYSVCLSAHTQTDTCTSVPCELCSPWDLVTNSLPSAHCLKNKSRHMSYLLNFSVTSPCVYCFLPNDHGMTKLFRKHLMWFCHLLITLYIVNLHLYNR